ncbi:MAG: YedE-related selenium metabolism membrane protein [Ezakiella sp.]|nr:YedE-related selenium metabolism membrane protein [Ezakiella sp.]MDD7472409.1 YedE family putative selenium transporter [Bacillota bacterium]MDY3923143.1 YedE family putative selenium transporter [Ezakiella sp.]
MKKRNLTLLISGLVIGAIGALLVYFGNPGNMGICVACFWRDVAGALGLHHAGIVQYIRPEILGFVLGACVASIFGKDFKSRGGSSPMVRFILGFFVMIGALIFLGCPLRMLLRIGGGDMNAVVGLLGYIFGILIGVYFLKRGFSLGRAYKQSKFGGYVMPIIALALLILLLVKPEFIAFSEEGPGSMHAPIIISLIAGLIVGTILQRTRLCTAAGFRDAFLIKDYSALLGLCGIVLGALILNLILGQFKFGFADQPVAHTNQLWNFLGMVLVGLASCLLGGCPIRQTILSGEGDQDAAVTVLGLIVGAAFAHNFGLASSGKGVTPNGMVAGIIGLVVVVIIGLTMKRGRE